MRRLHCALFALMLILVPSAARAQDAKAAAETITPADMRARIGFLSSDEMKGRDTPSPGLQKAAEYIAAEFKSFGLQPLGDSGAFIQYWPFRSGHLKREAVKLEARGPQESKTYAYSTDFFLVSNGSDSVVANAAFAGDAKNAGTLEGAPRGRSLWFYIEGTPSQAWQQVANGALQAASKAGAKSIVLILDASIPAQAMGFITAQTAGATVPPTFPIIVGLRYDAAKEILKSAGQDLDALKDKPGVVTMDNLSIALHAPSEGSSRVPNVVGLLPGSDPKLKDEYVVFSGHMDHVGVGSPVDGDSIYNGADDDASGTSVVIEVAQAFAAMKVRPKRSLIFLTVSGEEKGLLGSNYFVDNPPVPLAKIVADINTDMIGRNNPDSVVAIGQEYSSLGPTVQSVTKAHPELHLTVAPDLWPEERLFFRSDHFNFARKNVAAIFFTTGLHEDYHKPSDEVDKIDTDKAARIARLVFYLGNEVANAANPPKWTEKGIADLKQMQ